MIDRNTKVKILNYSSKLVMKKKGRKYKINGKERCNRWLYRIRQDIKTKGRKYLIIIDNFTQYSPDISLQIRNLTGHR